MSRAGVKDRKHEAEPMPPIPMSPQSVQRWQRGMREKRQVILFASCRSAAWKGHFPLFLAPEVHGQRLADMMMGQIIEQQIRARQSKIVMPR